MKKLIVLVLVAAGTVGAVYAHDMYQGKAFTFTSGPVGSHKVDVIIDSHNVLTVMLDDKPMGSRNNFCTPVN